MGKGRRGSNAPNRQRVYNPFRRGGIVMDDEVGKLKGRIAELERETAELRGENAFFRFILNTVDAMICVIRSDGTIKYANRGTCDKLGYTEDELLTTRVPAPATLTEEDMKLYAEYMARVFAGERPLSWDNWAICKDGSKKRFMWTCTATDDAEGKAQYLIASGIDITELWNTREALRREKERAERATELKDRFVEIVSHDLTPISG